MNDKEWPQMTASGTTNEKKKKKKTAIDSK